MSTGRSWRDVARVARQHKFDKFKAAEKKQETKTTDEDVKKDFARRGSMNFKRANTSNPIDSEFRNKRASWSSETSARQQEARPAVPPPPPPKMSKAVPEKQQTSVPVNNSKNEQRENGFKENDFEQENTKMGETPSKSAKAKESTPLQERTNQPVAEPPSTMKKAESQKAKAFAVLLKENMLSYYEILEIKEDASEKDILKAYRSWAKLVHPDHNKTDTATEDFQALTQIFETLRTPKSRLAYNCRQKLRQRAFSFRHRASAV